MLRRSKTVVEPVPQESSQWTFFGLLSPYSQPDLTSQKNQSNTPDNCLDSNDQIKKLNQLLEQKEKELLTAKECHEKEISELLKHLSTLETKIDDQKQKDSHISMLMN
jgi:small-conductance mechanosensitive channel